MVFQNLNHLTCTNTSLKLCNIYIYIYIYMYLCNIYMYIFICIYIHILYRKRERDIKVFNTSIYNNEPKLPEIAEYNGKKLSL